MFEKLRMNPRLWKEIDYPIIICIISIVFIGILSIFSIVGSSNAEKQFVWLMISLVAMYFIIVLDYKILCNYAPIFYWATIALLILNDFFIGSTINGAKGWIMIGSVGFQPAEFAKLSLILMLGKKLEDMESNVNNLKNFFILFVYSAIPMLLIVIQPDMGMMMVCFFIILGIFFMSGLNSKVILGGFAAIILAVMVVWNSGIMKPHWKERLTSFINPEKYESTIGHQVIQSKTAIGSGELTGTGFLKGKQMKFVPEPHTDCIISVLGEQWGFIGIIVLLMLYGVVFWRMLKIAMTAKDIFGYVTVIGLLSYFVFALMQNIGMNIGIMPVTGITLPFVSYGGSSLLTNFIALGVVLNIGMRRKKINF